jgi:site-specific recombinase XerD
MTMPPHSLDQYLEAAQRENTLNSYASDIRHFEITFGGLLPATTQSVANYLAAYATTLSVSTLRRRLAALAQWHREHGFADPTTALIVKKALKGIKTLHPAETKQAEPLQLTAIAKIADWLTTAIAAAEDRGDIAAALRHRRDKALLLLGFWRGFRGDELIHLNAQHIKVIPGHGMTCFLAQTKGDRQNAGTTYRVPALSRWCPVTATLDWMSAANIVDGPLFRGINQWGDVASTPLHRSSVVPLLRRLFTQAGLASPETYSGHSLRRGFAGWANANGWDIKALMEYVGWKDVQSAMRYIDVPDAYGQQRIEAAIRPTAPALPAPSSVAPSELPAAAPSTFALTLTIQLTPRRKGKTSTKPRQTIEGICLAPHQAVALNRERSKYALTVEAENEVVLSEIASSLIEDLYRIADNHDHDLDAALYDEVHDRRWV